MEAGLKFSTNDVPLRQRADWWREVICRQYANVEITSSVNERFSCDTAIYPWQGVQLSNVRSSAISIKRLSREPELNRQDAYFAVVLLSGDYLLEQDGREVFLQPGDMSIYDATRPHRIHCPRDFSKVIFSVPRTVMRSKLAAIETCTAIRIPGSEGVGLVASNFLRSCAAQVEQLAAEQISILSEQVIDMLTLATASVRPTHFNLSRSRSRSICHVKAFIERQLTNPNLDTNMVVEGTGLSSRYINKLFEDENTSLMRYILKIRLDKCRQDILNATTIERISDIAFRWGFNDLSHFSRAFKQRFDISPRDCGHSRAKIYYSS